MARAVGAVRVAGLAPPAARLGSWLRPWLHRLAIGLRWLARAVEVPWGAYPSLLLLQLKVMWGDWDLRDLSPGDTADYFLFAYGWATHLSVEIVRSPLYTAFYGTLLKLGSDAASVTYAHRLLIVLGGDLLVLALFRRLLPAGLAWLLAGWWTLQLGNFDVMYEVHLFGFLPVLVAGLVAALPGRWAAWRRGSAAAILLAGALLVRNELAVPFGLVLIACALSSRRPWLPLILPLGLVVLLTAGFYARSTVQYPALLDDLRAKHTLNVCQVYAFAYAERHPDWSDSPWTECDGLMQATFGQPRPTLLEALRVNPRAMLGQFAWNVRLARAGLEFALFNAAAGQRSPDFAQVQTGQPLPRVLGIGLLGVLLAGGLDVARGAYRRRTRSVAAAAFGRWTAAEPRAWGWLVLLAGAVGATVVLLAERPRAEYLYGLTVLIMAAAGWSVVRLTRRWPRCVPVAIGLAVCLLAVWPGYYANADHARPRDLLETYQRLAPYADLIADPHTRFLKGEYNAAIASYVGHRADVDNVLDYSVLDERPADESLASFLDAQGISLAYFDAPLLSALQQQGEPLLESPEQFGWRYLAVDTAEGQWLLLQRLPPSP